jgi:hypothetical protein
MNEGRFNSLYRGLPAQAKKVYDVMPPKSAVSIVKLMTELKKHHPSMCDYKVVMSCIQALLSSGLVTEKVRGEFIRVGVSPKEATHPEPFRLNIPGRPIPNATQQEQQMQKDAAPTPIDRLGMFAIRLRELATDMEDAALELASQAEKDGLEAAKMRQLQTLLKSLS